MSDSKASHGIPAVTVLHGHTSMDTAHLTEDYPYRRRLRCQRREWLERKPGHGFRFVTQTTDPRRAYEHWNAPKASTYLVWAVMTQEDPRDGEDFRRIGWTGFHIWGPGPVAHTRFALAGILAQLDGTERKEYRAHLRISRERGDVRAWERWAEDVAWLAAHRDDAGNVPTADQLLEATRHYMNEFEYPVAHAAVLAGFDVDATAAEFIAAPALATA